MWNHFIPVMDASSKIIKKQRMYYDVVLAHNTNNGTSSMKNHLGSCQKYPKYIDKNHRKIYTYQASNNATSGHAPCECEFIPEAIRLALAKMVIIVKKPFLLLNVKGFEGFVVLLSLNLMFLHISLLLDLAKRSLRAK